MTLIRTETVGENEIEEFDWNGKTVVYVNNQKATLSFEEEVRFVKDICKKSFTL